MNTKYNMLLQTRYTPHLIVKNRLMFSIPLYQRLFAWGENQVNGLMIDLKDHFLNNETDCKPYYIGQMTVVSQDRLYALIDGQQRFTVMTLFAIALLQCEELRDREQIENWKKFLLFGNRINFKGRKEDNNYVSNLINNSKDATYENTRMKTAISIMKDAMPKKDLDNFAKKVFNNLSFFFVELDESYVRNPASLNKYFEVMNSTGKGLEQHEILKVELMRNQSRQDILTRIWNIVSRMDKLIIPKENNHAELDKYNNLIQLCREKKYEDALSSLNSVQNHQDESLSIDVIKPSDKEPNDRNNNEVESAIVSFSKFLLMVLDLTGYYNGDETEKFYRPENLNTLFKKYKPTDILSFYGEMLHYRLLLDYYCVHMEYTQGVGRHILTIHDEYDIETTTCLKQYLSMLNVSTTYYRWLKPYLLRIHNEEQKPQVSDLLKYLKDIDAQIKEHQLPESLESMNYKDLQRKRYLFWRLDYYLFEKRHDYFSKAIYPHVYLSAVNNYEFRENRSVEHLHPKDESNNAEWESYNLNNFGNLAMISQSFNSTQNNDPVNVKFARISDQAKYNGLQSLKLYLMYLVADTRPEGWDEKVAEEHGKKMYELLKSTYTTELSGI